MDSNRYNDANVEEPAQGDWVDDSAATVDDDLLKDFDGDLGIIDEQDPDNTSYLKDLKDSFIVEVEFKGKRRQQFLNIHKLFLRCSDSVIVEAESGIDIGVISTCGIAQEKKQEAGEQIEKPKSRIIRIADDDDLEKDQANRDNEPDVIEKSRALVRKHNLEMKVTDAEWQLDRHRLTIFFTAPQRIDFRDLVKDLARTFRTRIELRQISTREETKRLGNSVGCCGLTLCCTTFLSDFNHVTLDHAKMQQLSNNIAKLSGNCGRLKCCLLYEYELYQDAFKDYPPLESKIKLEKSEAIITKFDIFKNEITIYNRGEGKYETLTNSELMDLIGKGRVTYPDSDHEKFILNEKLEDFDLEGSIANEN